MTKCDAPEHCLKFYQSAQYAVEDCIWLYNSHKKQGLVPRLQSNWEGLCTVLKRLSDITSKLGDGTCTRPHSVHVDHLWAAVRKATS